MLKKYVPKAGERFRQYYTFNGPKGRGEYIRMEGVAVGDGLALLTNCGQFLPDTLLGQVVEGKYDNDHVHTVKLKTKGVT